MLKKNGIVQIHPSPQWRHPKQINTIHNLLKNEYNTISCNYNNQLTYAHSVPSQSLSNFESIPAFPIAWFDRWIELPVHSLVRVVLLLMMPWYCLLFYYICGVNKCDNAEVKSIIQYADIVFLFSFFQILRVSQCQCQYGDIMMDLLYDGLLSRLLSSGNSIDW